MDKREALTEALDIVCPDYVTILKKYSDNSMKYGKLNEEITASKFLDVISKTEYNLLELGLSPATNSRLLKELFPNRKTNSTGTKICTFVLEQVGMKQCARCTEVLELTEFRLNSATKTGYNTYCKACHLETTKSTQASRQSFYRTAKMQRTPKWSETDKIKEFYAKCPEGCAVDHIIPLQGDNVSGLHVLNNLQYLTKSENSSKRNKYIPD